MSSVILCAPSVLRSRVLRSTKLPSSGFAVASRRALSWLSSLVDIQDLLKLRRLLM